jgi:lathosterol oxidase
MGRTIVESVDLSHQVLRSTARVRPLRPWASLESMSALFDPAASARELLPLWLAFFALTTALFVALGFAWERSPRGRARRIFAIPLAPGQLRRELLANVGFIILAAAAFSLTAAAGLLQPRGDGALAALLTFSACFIGFEAFYYLQHRALHTRALIRFHRWHHASRVTTPLSGQSLGLVEALGWIAGLLLSPALLSVSGHLHAGALLAYLTLSAAGNIIGHANAEPHPRSSGERGNSWATHPFTYHALHHARWTGHFGLGTTVLDRLLGTEWSDWPELHRRVLDGDPMRSFKDQGEHPARAIADGAHRAAPRPPGRAQ